MFTYVIVTVDDKLQSIKRCELSAVVIKVHGSCQLGACIYSLDCLAGVLHMLVFPVCGFVCVCLYYVCVCVCVCMCVNVYIYVAHLLVQIINYTRCTEHSSKHKNLLLNFPVFRGNQVLFHSFLFMKEYRRLMM